MVSLSTSSSSAPFFGGADSRAASCASSRPGALVSVSSVTFLTAPTCLTVGGVPLVLGGRGGKFDVAALDDADEFALRDGVADQATETEPAAPAAAPRAAHALMPRLAVRRAGCRNIIVP